jgi:ABC-2 type transport system ATP-binding protein
LKTLSLETFVLDLREPLDVLPTIENFSLRLVDALHLEVDLAKGQLLSDVFSRLLQEGVEVLSMRNKTNRLEELFVSLTGSDAGESNEI